MKMFNKNELKILDNMDLTGVRNPALIQLQLQRRVAKQLQEQFGPNVNEHMAKLRLLGKGDDECNGDNIRGILKKKR
mgnify:CR=1 FL=1